MKTNLIPIMLILSDMQANWRLLAMESLCDRPVINAADRLSNNTVRLYRGPYYWVLKGVPTDSGTLEGPFPIPYKDMGQIYKNNSVVTLLGGTDRGKTVKTEGKTYWMWDERGNLKTKKNGVIHNRFPAGGFDAVIHDGNPDDPTLIGFKGIKTYYLSTRYRVWTAIGNPSGYIGGKYKENFPTDVMAAFTLQPSDQSDQYIVYFFQKDKYCKRTKILESGQQCDQWLPNRQLFGCETLIKFEASGNDTEETNSQRHNPDPNNKNPGDKPSGSVLSKEASLCLSVTIIVINSFILF